MTKAEIVAVAAAKSGLNPGVVSEVFNQCIDAIRSANEKDKNVYIRGFGTFGVVTRAAKKGRNISKNTTIDIPSHRAPHFLPSKGFKKAVRENVTVG